MTEDVQGLINRIKKEAIEKADEEAQRLLKDAQEQAARILQEADSRAKKMLSEAELMSQQFFERGKKSLEQAARDIVLLLRQNIENIFTALIRTKIEAALDADLLKKLLVKVADSLSADTSRQLQIILSQADRQALADFFLQSLRQQWRQGVEIGSEDDIIKGFKIGFKDSDYYWDFSADMLAASLSRLLRPQLAEIVNKAAIGL